VGHYRVEVREPDPSLKIRVHADVDKQRVQVVGCYTSIRYSQPGFGTRPILVPFHPSGDVFNQISATIHRFACKMPDPYVSRERDFEAFVKTIVPLMFVELPHDEDVPAFHEWLQQSKYPGSRKLYFKRLYEKLQHFGGEAAFVKSFIKDEGYDEPKNARGINSPSDISKVLLAPIFHAIDEFTYRTKWFVKHTNPRDWPERMEQLFNDDQVFETDFKSMEAHHRGIYSRCVYFWMMHMMRSLTKVRELKDLVSRLVLGRQSVFFRDISVAIDYRMMSGAQWTSSGNAFLNLMVISYLASTTRMPDADIQTRVDWVLHDFRALVEGDDGICAADHFDPNLIKELGLSLTMSKHNDFSDAKFCGVICDRSDHVIVKDPISFLRKFFVLPAKYAQSSDKVKFALLRARALSYKCNFGNSPVIGPVCDHVLSLTRSFQPRYDADVLTWWGMNSIKSAITEKLFLHTAVVPLTTRVVVEQRFGLTIAEQCDIESKFDCVTICPILDLSSHATLDQINHALDFVTINPKAWRLPERKHLSPFINHIVSHGLTCDKRDCSRESSRTTRMYNKRNHVVLDAW